MLGRNGFVLLVLFSLSLLAGIGGPAPYAVAQVTGGYETLSTAPDFHWIEPPAPVFDASGKIVGHLISGAGDQAMFLALDNPVAIVVRLRDGAVTGDVGTIGRLQPPETLGPIVPGLIVPETPGVSPPPPPAPPATPPEPSDTGTARPVVDDNGKIIGHIVGGSGEKVLYLPTDSIAPEWVRLRDGVVEGGLGAIGRVVEGKPAPVFQISFGKVAVELDGNKMVHRLVDEARLPGVTIPVGTVVFRGERNGDQWLGQSMTRTTDCGDYWTEARVSFDNTEPDLSTRMEIFILAPAPSSDPCDYVPGSNWVGPYPGERIWR